MNDFITVLVIWYVLFREEIDYIMMCVDANQDGKVDFLEFTERFHNPAKDIGFNVALLLTNLAEHMPNDPRSVMGPGSKLPDGSLSYYIDGALLCLIYDIYIYMMFQSLCSTVELSNCRLIL